MFRTVLSLLFIFTIYYPSNSQITSKGVFNTSYKSYDKGDTVVFRGAQTDKYSRAQYYYLKGSDKRVRADKVDLILDELDFWEIQQFYHTALQRSKVGWQRSKRDWLEVKTLDYLAGLEVDKRLFNDRYAEDFLQQIIQKIHYPEFNKGKAQNFNVKIVNDEKKYLYAFDNGTILLSSQLLAEIGEVDELVLLLTQAVAHVLLDSNIDNMNSNASHELRSLGAYYSEERKKIIRKVAEDFIRYTNAKAPGKLSISHTEFIGAMAGVIGYTAWQDYYSQRYKSAVNRISRLERENFANSSDLLLKAKCYTKLINTKEANEAAYKILLQAASFEDEILHDIYAEMGIVLIRLERYKDAREAFLKHGNMIKCTGDDEKIKWVNKMISTCNREIANNKKGNTSASKSY